MYSEGSDQVGHLPSLLRVFAATQVDLLVLEWLKYELNIYFQYLSCA